VVAAGDKLVKSAGFVHPSLRLLLHADQDFAGPVLPARNVLLGYSTLGVNESLESILDGTGFRLKRCIRTLFVIALVRFLVNQKVIYDLLYKLGIQVIETFCAAILVAILVRIRVRMLMQLSRGVWGVRNVFELLVVGDLLLFGP